LSANICEDSKFLVEVFAKRDFGFALVIQYVRRTRWLRENGGSEERKTYFITCLLL
jgi:hypothetical protein